MQTPEQRKVSNDKYYAKNREKVQALNNANKRRNMAFLAEMKLVKGCQRCGYREHAAALDFHHTDSSSKLFNLSEAAQRGHSLDKLRVEVEKCIVLCANCHRVEHAPLVPGG